VPYVKYGGLRYLEAAHVKDFVATARLLDNPADEVAWFRLLRLHPGIGPATARRLLPMLAPGAATEPGAGEAAATDPADPYALAVAATPPSGRVALAATLPALDEARNRPGAGGRAEAIVGLLRPLLIARYPDSASRLGDLERLAAASTAAPDLAALLAELTLDPPQSTADLAGPPHLDEDYLVLSTVHSAKGLEWPVVHLIHLVDGAFPSDMALGCEAGLAEERRLFYVAVTRARDELLLYAPLRMPHHRRARDDRHSYAAVSRFVDQAAQRAVDIVDVGVPRPRVRSPDAVAAVALPALGELWR
jgi:DNA helicase-2/ATP-dependent DNA helicase PcrA